MGKNTLCTYLLAALSFGTCLAQKVGSDSDVIEYSRRLAQTHRTIFPAAGIIPDEQTAKSLALAIAVPIWGKKMVGDQLPLLAGLKGNVWTVVGNPHFERVKLGGQLIIQLDRRNGAVLSILHTQ